MEPLPDQKNPTAFQVKADELHVWYITTGVLDSSGPLEPMEACLHPDERNRYQSLKLPKVRQNFLLSRGCLRYLLSLYLRVSPQAVEFAIGQFGKPELKPGLKQPRPQFNLSHTQDRIAIAVHLQRAVGIDVERLKSLRHRQRLYARCLTPREIETILPLPEQPAQYRFLRYWTAKEAVLKALGVGLYQPMDQIEVSLAEQNLDESPNLTPVAWVPREEKSQNAGEFYLHQWQPESEYIVATAVEKRSREPLPKIMFRRITPLDLIQQSVELGFGRGTGH